ncbi:MAG: 23S rRNA (adenine(2503)-C(2))-methyltransferase RlmN [Desulfobulbaceae bacterium]|uniref:Probable dual-specificity RNA methyltransferase RlmN n=1 Tax=Candidatus Desulfatifera sulfidica TaxID=2841691 RepID=A0A8J6NAX0_9BACT|nr:23S rRNA (adenine(2503)-C(2))-methyltransferase RlmN [Candidatus Desulfatifera sulfidica]
MTTRTDLRNLTQEEIVDYVESLGQPAFRGRQIMAWLYRPGISEFSQMTDLAKDFRRILSEHAYMSSFQNPLIERSKDGCVKFGFRLDDGKMIESVLIPEPDRNTLCVSSQVGCAMNCSFCLTATMGFIRNLSPAEIVNQVCAVGDFLRAESKGNLIGSDRVTNIVFMGMGEPLNNLDNLLKSLSILTEQRGLDLTNRRITVSTCGIVPQMQILGENSTANLAVSLHAVDDETRDKLMPINRRYPVAELIEACRTFPMAKRKRIMFEYILLKGINDSDAEAHKLAKLLRGIPCKINLLPYNESPAIPYKSPSYSRILSFQKILMNAKYSVFVRSSRGSDISAACGQLAREENSDIS